MYSFCHDEYEFYQGHILLKREEYAHEFKDKNFVGR